MNTRSPRHACSVLLASALLATGSAHAQNTDARADVFSNDYVSVSRFTLEPGDGLPLHQGASRVVYSLSDYTIKWTEDGSTTTMEWREGQVHQHGALDHAVENTGNTIADFLVVARTDEPLNGGVVEGDASTVAGGYAALVADLDGVRVLRVALPPGAQQPMHAGAARLAFALNDSDLVFIGRDGSRMPFTHVTGSAHWHDAGEHAVENTGSTTARYVLFAFSK